MRLGRARPQRQILTKQAVLPVVAPSGRIMSSIVAGGGLVAKGGLAGKGGGLAA